MESEGGQENVIFVKQEQFQDDEPESYEDSHTSEGCDDLSEISPVKEVKIESTDEPCANNVYLVPPQVKEEIKKEGSCSNSSSAPGVCQIWLDSNEGDQYYSESCKVEPGENDAGTEEKDAQECEQPNDFQEYFPDIMPHFLSAVAESIEQSQSKLVSCHKCGQLCEAGNFMEHIQLKHTNKPKPRQVPKPRSKSTNNKYLYPCPYCQRGLRTISKLKFHILSHTQEKPYKCPFCDYRGNQHSSVDYHIQTKHYNTKRYQCQKCNYSSTTLRSLKNHNKNHRSTCELRQCPHCPLTTYKLLVYQRHVKRCLKKKMKSKTDKVCPDNKDDG